MLKTDGDFMSLIVFAVLVCQIVVYLNGNVNRKICVDFILTACLLPASVMLTLLDSQV